jgi:hypothetical protein
MLSRSADASLPPPPSPTLLCIRSMIAQYPRYNSRYSSNTVGFLVTGWREGLDLLQPNHDIQVRRGWVFNTDGEYSVWYWISHETTIVVPFHGKKEQLKKPPDVPCFALHWQKPPTCTFQAVQSEKKPFLYCRLSPKAPNTEYYRLSAVMGT